MKIKNNIYFYDIPIWKNRYLGALILLSVVSLFLYYYEQNISYMIISLVFAIQLLFSIPLIFLRPRYCKFTEEYIEFRGKIFDPVIKVNPGYLKSITLSDDAMRFNRINGSTDILDFPAKDSVFFHKRIKSFAKAYNLQQLKKIYLKDKKAKLSELIQNTLPFILIIMVSLIKEKKSIADRSVWMMILIVFAGIVAFFIRKKYRAFLLISDSDLTIKNSFFKPSQTIVIENIKRIDKHNKGFIISTYTNQQYKINSTNDHFQIVKSRITGLIENHNISSNFTGESRTNKEQTKKEKATSPGRKIAWS